MLLTTTYTSHILNSFFCAFKRKDLSLQSKEVDKNDGKTANPSSTAGWFHGLHYKPRFGQIGGFVEYTVEIILDYFVSRSIHDVQLSSLRPTYDLSVPTSANICHCQVRKGRLWIKLHWHDVCSNSCICQNQFVKNAWFTLSKSIWHNEKEKNQREFGRVQGLLIARYFF